MIAPYVPAAGQRRIRKRAESPRELRDLIHSGKAEPSWVVSHHLSLDEGPDAYGHFDAREDGRTKVILHPDGR